MRRLVPIEGCTKESIPSRSSVIHSSILKHLLSVQLLATAAILSIEKPIRKELPYQGITLQHISLTLLGHPNGVGIDGPAHTPIVQTSVDCPAETNRENEVPPQESPTMTDEFLQLIDSVQTAVGKVPDAAQGTYTFITHYRLSSQQIEQTDPGKIDCNDLSNSACEKLSRIGLPMYLISICPKHLPRDIASSWHQFAASKINDKELLIVDGRRVTIWQGTLREYVALRSSAEIEMRIVPMVGISRYTEPLVDTPVAKALQQVLNGVAEEDMAVFTPGERTFPSSTLAQNSGPSR